MKFFFFQIWMHLAITIHIQIKKNDYTYTQCNLEHHTVFYTKYIAINKPRAQELDSFVFSIRFL